MPKKKRKLENQELYDKEAEMHGQLGLNSTLYLAYRDLPEILETHLFSHTQKKRFKIVDFGCGPATNSTKSISEIFAQKGLDADIFGLDINETNLELAKKNMPNVKYFKITRGELSKEVYQQVKDCDLVFCTFVLLENETEFINSALKHIYDIMADNAILITSCNTSKLYNTDRKWYSEESNFKENAFNAQRLSKKTLKFKPSLYNGQKVKTRTIDTKTGAAPVFTDFFYNGQTYKNAYHNVGLKFLKAYKPLGREGEEFPWEDELKYPPYKIHVITKPPQNQDTPSNDVPRITTEMYKI